MVNRQRAYQLRNRVLGLCAKCATPAGTNPHTGKPYELCPAHRKAKSAQTLAAYYKRKDKK